MSLIGLMSLIGPLTVLAQSQLKSGKYVIEGLQIGQEITAFSKEESIKPVIAAEGPILTNLQDASVEVEWTTDKSASSIVIFRKNLPGTTSEEQGRSADLVKSHKVKLVGLEPNSDYLYRVKSVDKVGNIGESAELKFTTKKSAGIVGPTFSDLTLSSFIFSFQTIAIINAKIFYGPNPDNLDQVIEEESGSLTTNHVIRLSGLEPGTTYYLKIIATDAFSKKIGSDLYATSTLPKPAILNISVIPRTPNEVLVRWQTNTETDSIVEYSSPSAQPIEGVTGGETQSQGSTSRVKDHEVKLLGLAGNTTYQAKVLAQDKFGNQAESLTFSFKTPRDSQAPKIAKLKVDTETLAAREGSAVSALVTWTTDEPATSQIRYGQGTIDRETARDELLTQSHVVVLEGLSPAASYKLEAASRDPSGNSATSPTTTFLTRPKRRSLAQLLTQKLEEYFGWMRNLGVFQ